MSGIFAFVLFVSIIAWVIGLVNPRTILRWGQVRTRGRLSLIFVPIILLSMVMVGDFTEPVDETPETAIHSTFNMADRSSEQENDPLGQTTTSEDTHPSQDTADIQSRDDAGATDTQTASSISENSDRTSSEQDSAQETVQSNKNGQVSHASSQHNITGDMTVHFIDVGQGDATLLMGPDFTILIDAGQHQRNDVVPYLQKVGVSELDLVIGTHPHADHIGQLDKVINTFPVTEVWMSGDTHTSKTFERALDAILASEANYAEPRAGESYTIGSLELTVVNPPDLSGGLNDNSVAVRVQYGEVSFLFTGDAEQTNELKMVRSGNHLQADILHVGHHGSSTSSTQAFLDKVQPDIAIYSAGLDNSYGHPHAEVIQRLKDMKITIYGTDVHGTIKVVTDGSSYEIETARAGEVASAVVSDKRNQSDPSPSSDTPTESTVPTPEPDAQIVGESCSEGQVNINTASIEQLKKIKHIGDVRAKALIELRPFKSVDDMTRISGIAAGRLSDIKSEGIACVE